VSVVLVILTLLATFAVGTLISYYRGLARGYKAEWLRCDKMLTSALQLNKEQNEMLRRLLAERRIAVNPYEPRGRS
jgi:hypothetical protein